MTVDGVALLSTGTTTVTGYIILSVRENRTSEEVEIADESGDIVTHINTFGEKSEVEFDVIAKSGTATPAIGATFTYTSATDGAGEKITITSLESTEQQKDATRWTLRGMKYPNITIT